MGRLDPTVLRYLTKDDFRILQAIGNDKNYFKSDSFACVRDCNVDFTALLRLRRRNLC